MITQLTLYSKPGCHLCEELRRLLDELQPQFGFALEEIDITGDPTLFAEYRHNIPVLLKGGNEVARGRIAERDLVQLLKGKKHEAKGNMTDTDARGESSGGLTRRDRAPTSR